MKRDFHQLYLEKIRQRGGLKNYVRRKSLGPIGMMVNRIVKAIPNGCEILEVGTGTGALASLLAEKGYAVTAIDNDDRMVALADECAKALGVRFDCLNLDMFDIAHRFERHRFGCVVSHGVMEHYDDALIASALHAQLTVSKISIFSVPGSAMSKEYKSRGDGSERYLSPHEWIRILEWASIQCDTVFGAGFGKYCEFGFVPDWLSRIDRINRKLASKAAFMEFWTHR